MARILIVDDDEVVRKATRAMLEAYGFEVTAVDNGQAGVDAIKAFVASVTSSRILPNAQSSSPGNIHP